MKPHVILHNQVSLDGRMDHLPIDPGLFYETAAKFGEDATLAGADTLLVAMETFGNEPSETAAGPDAPLLVVPDSRGRIRQWRKLLATPYWRAGVALCTAATPPFHVSYLEEAGIEVLTVGTDRVDLAAALTELAERHDVKTVRVDSGGTLNGALLRAGLVSEVSVLVSPHLVGGTSANSICRAPDLADAAGVTDLEPVSIETLRGGVVWLRYRIR